MDQPRLSGSLRLVALALAVTATIGAAAAPGASGAAACPRAHTSVASLSRKAARAAVVCLLNRERRSRGLPALHQNGRLNRSAQGWTNAMVRTGQFAHGRNFATRITAAGYRWSWVGENIATGYSTPADVVAAWMASTGHCQNILDPHFADVGTGVVPRGIGPLRTGPATWTQDFGLPRGAAVPSHDTAPQSGCPY